MWSEFDSVLNTIHGHLKTYALCKLKGFNCVEVTDLKKKKDWIEQPIVFAPTKLKPAAPSCWDHFRGKAYSMPWVK